MRSNSGRGKSNNNFRDPTIKEHEERRKDHPAIHRSEAEEDEEDSRRGER